MTTTSIPSDESAQDKKIPLDAYTWDIPMDPEIAAIQKLTSIFAQDTQSILSKDDAATRRQFQSADRQLLTEFRKLLLQDTTAKQFAGSLERDKETGLSDLGKLFSATREVMHEKIAKQGESQACKSACNLQSIVQKIVDSPVAQSNLEATLSAMANHIASQQSKVNLR